MRYYLLLLFLIMETAVLAEPTTYPLAWAHVTYKSDTIQTRTAQTNRKPTRNQTKPFWKRVGKGLLWLVIVLGVIYLLGLLVVLALTSMGTYR